MLKEGTVFVLGAGASHSYGLPTGPELKRTIVASLAKSSGLQPTTFACLTQLGHSNSDIKQFRNALQDSGKASVDAFLEGQPRFIPIGKRAMASVLLRAESHKKLFRSKDENENWCQYLFNKLGSKFDDLRKNTAAFLTFNYDRSLEYYLVTAIRNSYDKKFSEAKALADKWKIIHLYGHLGELADDSMMRWRQPTLPNAEEIKRAADGIRIMSSPSDTEKNFATAHNLISQAGVICFLGFGYHETNIERLLGGVEYAPHAQIIGSAFGLREAERSSVETDFQRHKWKVKLGEPTDKVLEFLRNKFVWW